MAMPALNAADIAIILMYVKLITKIIIQTIIKFVWEETNILIPRFRALPSSCD